MYTATSLKALGFLLKTLPFGLFRLLVCAAFALAVAGLTLAGAWLAHALSPGIGDRFISDAGLGGVAGFVVGVVLVAGLGDRLRRSVDVGGLALLAEWLDDRPVPFGFIQVIQARQSVARRFGSQADLSALCRLVRSIVARVPGVAEGPGNLFALPGLGRIGTGGLVERAVLAEAYAGHPENAWEAAHDAIVLATQNASRLLTSAAAVTAVGWGLTLAVFGSVLATFSGPGWLWPDTGPFGGVILAGCTAWVSHGAVILPLATATFLQLFRATIAGQAPLPEWRGRLTQASDRFRRLGEHAIDWTPKAASDL